MPLYGKFSICYGKINSKILLNNIVHVFVMKIHSKIRNCK